MSTPTTEKLTRKKCTACEGDVPRLPADEVRGVDLLSRPTVNKGTAFTQNERDRLSLNGLLPPVVESLDQQVVRAYEAYRRKDDDLERHIYLRALPSGLKLAGERAECLVHRLGDARL